MSKPFLNCDSSVILDPTSSKGRRDYFMGPKIKAFRKASGSDQCYDGIKNVSLPDFVAMLEVFCETDATDQPLYNAVRIYFGAFPTATGSPNVPPGKLGFPTLLFVPTTGNVATPGLGQVVTNLYYYIDANGHVVQDTAGVAGGWIKNFKDIWVPALNKDGKDVTKGNFNETLTLIYPIDSIAGDGDDEIGLLGVIQCGLDDTENPITGLDILFSCFTTKETVNAFKYPYQLSLIFHMPQKRDRAGVSFGSAKYRTGLVDADTGMPCPPNGNCQ